MSKPALVHFQTVNKRGEKRPACKPFASNWTMTGRTIFFNTTTDKAQVTCTKCAKIGGFEAAAVVEVGQSGTCQCCFGTWKLMPKSTSLHGYRRPGYGWIVGECWGSKSVPFEVSCEKTKALRAEYKAIRTQMQQRLADLEGDKVEKLTHHYQEYDRNASKYKQFSVEVLKGAEETKIPYHMSTREWDKHTVPSFATLLERNIRDTKGQIQKISGAIAELDEKIANWKQVWAWSEEEGRYVAFKAVEVAPADPVAAAKEAVLAAAPVDTTCPCCKKTLNTRHSFGVRLMNKAEVETGAVPRVRLQSQCKACRSSKK